MDSRDLVDRHRKNIFLIKLFEFPIIDSNIQLIPNTMLNNNMDKKKETLWAKNLLCIEYRGRFCKNCGFDGFDNPWIMEFHHRNPADKSFTIGNKTASNRFEKIKDELDKCDLLCSHCHKTLHAAESLKEYNSIKDSVLKSLDTLKANNCNAEKIGLHKKYPRSTIEKYISEGKTIGDISKIIGETYRSTQALLFKYGLETISGKRPRTNKESSIIRDYTKHKYSIARLSQKYSKSEDEIITFLRDRKIDIKKPMSKIDVDSVKKLLSEGVPKSKIWKILGCGEYSIYRLCKRHNL